jgi:hypothetical protein
VEVAVAVAPQPGDFVGEDDAQLERALRFLLDR